MHSAQVFRSGLWILGEYCESAESVMKVMQFIRKSFGELPIVEKEMQVASGDEVVDEKNENSIAEVTSKVSELLRLILLLCFAKCDLPKLFNA